jgi:hypothetical protein
MVHLIKALRRVHLPEILFSPGFDTAHTCKQPMRQAQNTPGSDACTGTCRGRENEEVCALSNWVRVVSVRSLGHSDPWLVAQMNDLVAIDFEYEWVRELRAALRSHLLDTLTNHRSRLVLPYHYAC